jgi:hypothetical protein
MRTDAPRRRPFHRPRLSDEARRRFRLTLHLTGEELATLEARARAFLQPPAVYTRRAALGDRLELPRVPQASQALQASLARLGNNLNQLTKLAHQGRLSPALVPLLAELAGEVRATRRALLGFAVEPEV